VFWTNPGLHILEEGVARDVTERDLGQIARLCDGLSNVQGIMGMAMKDVQPRHRDLVGVRVIAENTRKHVRALCFTPQGMEALSEMKKVFPGNWLSIGFTAHGPLRWTNLALDIFLKSSGSGIPTTVNGEPMAGATGPVTLAGSTAVGSAEILSGIVVNQVLEPGRPVIYHLGLAHIFDMKYATAVTGGPENALFATASAEMGRYYQIPSSSWVSTESMFDDSQAALEKMFGYATHVAHGSNLIWGMGQLESEKTISPVQLVIDNEAIDYVRRFQDGFEVSRETLQLDLIREVGIGGSYLETDHTLMNYRDHLWIPSILNRQERERCKGSLEEAARDEARRILDENDEQKIAEAELAELKRIEEVYRNRIS
jgi:trimethylamine--corrinoid protein Co-methyltransferase